MSFSYPTIIVRKYLQYHFDGKGKLKLMKNEDKEEGEEEKRRRKIHPSGLEFSGFRWNAGKRIFQSVFAKYMQPAVLQLNIEGTTVSKIGMVECLAHATKALIVLLQEIYFTCVASNSKLCTSWVNPKQKAWSSHIWP